MLTNLRKSIVAMAALLLPTMAFALPPVYTLQGGVGNLDIGRDSDSFYYLTAGALWSKPLTNNSILDLTGEISTFTYSDSDLIDGEEIFLQAAYSYTPRAGFRVPTYSLAIRYVDEMLSLSSWDAVTISFIGTVSYRLNDRTNIKGGLKFGERDVGAEKDVSGYFFDLDYRYSPDWLLFTTLSMDEGAFSVRGYCSGYGTGSGTGWYERIDCDTTSLTFGASYIINGFNTLQLSLSHKQYELPGWDDDGILYSLDYFYRF